MKTRTVICPDETTFTVPDAGPLPAYEDEHMEDKTVEEDMADMSPRRCAERIIEGYDLDGWEALDAKIKDADVVAAAYLELTKGAS
jgi:hypothetical protein